MSKKAKLNLLKAEPIGVVDVCIGELKKRENSSQAKPLVTTARESLRLNGMEPPPSLKRFLSFDFTFNTMCSKWGDFDNTEPMGKKTPAEWQPVAPENEIELWIKSLANKPVKGLKLLDEADELLSSPHGYLNYNLTGKLFQLPNFGDQTHFLYVGKPDHFGEYPVLGFEMQGRMEEEEENSFYGLLSVWVKYPNFAVYLYDQIFDVDINLDDFKIQAEEIYRNNPELRGS